MEGNAYALASGTIINAIATGKGSAFGLDLKVYAKVKLIDDGKGKIEGKVLDNPNIKPNLIIRCVKNTLEYFNLDYSAYVETKTEIPIRSGLSSSSATSNAVVLATFDALNEKIDDELIIELGIKSSFDEGLTITGAYDDATASYFGGITITDNIKREIIKKDNMDENLNVLVIIPKLEKNLDVESMKAIGKFVDVAYNEALKGNYFKALFLNGILYASALKFPTNIAIDALKSGALTAGLSGTGPSYIAIVEDDHVEKVMSTLNKYGKVIKTKPNNCGAKII
ncbi:shikimate kinase [Methanocaldococcus vulcanius M7]|uniref:Shikimate kinase n=1 Tax=Methanocaldococcus vulcanius (strain ATCC 700851 / DSM 12094 / M7) TaxID=579137 RepID=C9RH22_METVM|nr:shikimate kinase [Methanocaldococcus vulcanius]ACX72874.1 shikimate kinase [Methanocaldococcus vulcanius M7]